MSVLGAIFILIFLSIAGDTIVKISRARGRPDDTAGQVARLEAQLREQAAALADARALIDGQTEHIEELYERLEFTERMLARIRERPELPGGPDSG